MKANRTLAVATATLIGLALCLGAHFQPWEVRDHYNADLHWHGEKTRYIDGYGSTVRTETDWSPYHTWRQVGTRRNGFQTDPAGGVAARLALIAGTVLALRLTARRRGLVLLACGAALIGLGLAARNSAFDLPGLYTAGAVTVLLAGAADLLLGATGLLRQRPATEA